MKTLPQSTSSRRQPVLRRFSIPAIVRNNMQLVILVIMAVALAATTPKFASAANLMNILKQVSVIAIISCGMTFVVVGGCLDLSVGSAMSLLTVITATLQLKSDLWAVLAPLGAAVLIGLFNGLIITRFKINSIIVTLGSLSVFGGLALLYTNGAIIIGRTGTWYSQIAQGQIFRIPVHVLIFVVIILLSNLLLRRTSFGKALYYIGTNSEAARIAGIRINLFRTLTFVLSSIFVAIAAVILSSRMNSGSPVSGVGFEFDAITAIVIGGTSLTGGKGSIRSTVIGVLLLAVIVNALTLYNVPYAFQNIAKGLMILAAVIIDIRSRAKYGK